MDIYEAYKTWPADVRAKLSLHDLRRMDGWEPHGAVGDWCIDTSTPSPILTYQRCSVIQDEQASYVMGLIAKDHHVPPNNQAQPDRPKGTGSAAARS